MLVELAQLQGALLATGRAECHLVSWTPYGAKVFVVPSSRAYQARRASDQSARAGPSHGGRPSAPRHRRRC